MKAERIITPEEKSFPWGFSIVVTICALLAGSVGYFMYNQVQQSNQQNFAKLKISLADFDGNQISQLLPLVQNYTADYCDPRSKAALLRKLSDRGFVKLSSQLATEHYERCAKDSSFLEIASSNYSRLGEYSKALEISNRLVETDPASAEYRFWRGKVYEGMERFEKALVDYISALDLLGRPEQVGANQFYEIATMYAALGKFCEAATPLETYIAYDYAKRRTAQLDRLIGEYRTKGGCKNTSLSENAVIRAKKPGSVLLIEASLNDVSGVFILDTGASMVSVTKSFAAKSGVSLNSENEVTMHTANGAAKGILSAAKSVQVGSFLSTSVPVIVMDDTQLGSDTDVVGLLGMSFLSRFDVTINKGSVELRSR